MEDKIEVVVTGKIVGMDYHNRKMLVKDSEAVTFELKWREKPEVVDDLCKKQKVGYRVKVVTVKNPNEDNAQFWITNVQYDDSYKQRKGYATSPEEQKLILLQSCFRTGAQVFGDLLRVYAPSVLDNDGGYPEKVDLGKIYESSMNTIMERAKRDAANLLAEAKRNA